MSVPPSPLFKYPTKQTKYQVRIVITTSTVSLAERIIYIFIFVKEINKILFYLAEKSTFLEWVRHRYGVYPTHGFQGDHLYPAFFQEGLQEIEAVGCNASTETTAEQMVSEE